MPERAIASGKGLESRPPFAQATLAGGFLFACCADTRREGKCAIGDARPREPHRQREHDRQRPQGEVLRLYPRSVAPVALATAATTFCATASISASVSVFSRGCSVTSMARLTLPSGRFGPA